MTASADVTLAAHLDYFLSTVSIQIMLIMAMVTMIALATMTAVVAMIAVVVMVALVAITAVVLRYVFILFPGNQQRVLLPSMCFTFEVIFLTNKARKL
jgi:hypothetical protein